MKSENAFLSVPVHTLQQHFTFYWVVLFHIGTSALMDTCLHFEVYENYVIKDSNIHGHAFTLILSIFLIKYIGYQRTI